MDDPRHGVHATPQHPTELHPRDEAMNAGRLGPGHWKALLSKRARDHGYTSLTAFAETRPTASLVALAEELGVSDVSAVQTFQLLLEEAERSHRLTHLVRGQLVRELSACLPHGWPAVMDDSTRFKMARALGWWSTFTPKTHQERADQVLAALHASPPPLGWRPVGPDDELLRTLMPDD